MKPVIAMQMVTRAILWLLVFSFEFVASDALKHIPQIYTSTYLYYVATIVLTVIFFVLTLGLGNSALVRDLRELCFYDVLVQCTGLALYLSGHRSIPYMALCYIVVMLKFMRILWMSKDATGESFISWPVFGLIGLTAKVRGIATPSGGSSHQDALAYASMMAVIATISLIYVAGVKIAPFSYLAWVMILLITAYYQRIMDYLEEQEANRIAAATAILVEKATALINIELATNNAALAASAMTLKAKNAELAASAAALAAKNDELDVAAQERSQLIANIEAKNEMLCDASHDLKAPMTVVSMHADALIKVVRDIPDIASHTVPLTQSVQTMFACIDNTIHNAQIATSIAPPVLTAFSAEQLSGEWVRTYEPLCKKYDIEFFMRPLAGKTDFHIAINPEIFNRILVNLINNALIHSGTREIFVSLRQRGPMCLVGVWDTGCGIKGAAGLNGASNFRAFAQRIAIRTQNGYQGVGHGLGINNVSRLCIAMGSTMTLRSHVGRGTVFQFTVPLASQAQQDAAALTSKFPLRTPAAGQ
jgi:signal transduction histidine kinase